MNNLRRLQNYLLVSAFVFKTVLAGALFTLAHHNICFTELLDGDFNWSQLVKQRKRNDESSQNAVNFVDAIFETDEKTSSRKFFPSPINLIIFLFSCTSSKIKCFFHLSPRVEPERLFIRYRSIIR